MGVAVLQRGERMDFYEIIIMPWECYSIQRTAKYNEAIVGNFFVTF
jgi:hypothetical protein